MNKVIIEIRVISKFSKRSIPRITKMNFPLPSIAIGGLAGTPPSSRPSSPSKPVPRTDNLIPQFGDFTGHTDKHMLKNMCDAISELNLWGWLSTFTPNEKEGFMWSNASEINQIGRHSKVEADGHSGASFAWCMRNMEIIAKNGWNYYYFENIVPNILKKTV
jgi:hypothetical protein